MATCLLCPDGDRHLPDDEVAVHARREHGETAEAWPSGRWVVTLDEELMWEEWSR